MTIRGKRKFKYPGGRWFIWAMHKNRLLATIAASEVEWMEILNAYRCVYPVINARPL